MKRIVLIVLLFWATDLYAGVNISNDGRGLNLQVTKVPLVTVLTEIGELADIQFFGQDIGAKELVTLRLEFSEIAEGLDTLLKKYNKAYIFDEQERLKKVFILGRCIDTIETYPDLADDHLSNSVKAPDDHTPYEPAELAPLGLPILANVREPPRGLPDANNIEDAPPGLPESNEVGEAPPGLPLNDSLENAPPGLSADNAEIGTAPPGLPL